jgi:hypothetical protein
MSWFTAPLSPTDFVLGIPVFWLQRAIKTLQFSAGLVILLEILGDQKVAAFASAIFTRVQKFQAYWHEVAAGLRGKGNATAMARSYRIYFLLCISGAVITWILILNQFGPLLPPRSSPFRHILILSLSLIVPQIVFQVLLLLATALYRLAELLLRLVRGPFRKLILASALLLASLAFLLDLSIS